MKLPDDFKAAFDAVIAQQKREMRILSQDPRLKQYIAENFPHADFDKIFEGNLDDQK